MKCIMDMVSWMAVWIIEFFSFNASLSNFVHILSDSWNYIIYGLKWIFLCCTGPLNVLLLRLLLLLCLFSSIWKFLIAFVLHKGKLIERYMEFELWAFYYFHSSICLNGSNYAQWAQAINVFLLGRKNI